MYSWEFKDFNKNHILERCKDLQDEVFIQTFHPVLGYILDTIPVVPHKAVAEVSSIGNYRRDWLLRVTDGRAKTLMDRTVQLCN